MHLGSAKDRDGTRPLLPQVLYLGWIASRIPFRRHLGANDSRGRVGLLPVILFKSENWVSAPYEQPGPSAMELVRDP